MCPRASTYRQRRRFRKYSLIIFNMAVCFVLKTTFVSTSMQPFWITSSSSMALQPGVGQSLLLLAFHPVGFLVGKCAFCSEWPALWPHKFLLDPDETARAIWQAVRRLGWEMAAWFLLTDTTSFLDNIKLNSWPLALTCNLRLLVNNN
jgi:hypothetical protein